MVLKTGKYLSVELSSYAVTMLLQCLNRLRLWYVHVKMLHLPLGLDMLQLCEPLQLSFHPEADGEAESGFQLNLFD